MLAEAIFPRDLIVGRFRYGFQLRGKASGSLRENHKMKGASINSFSKVKIGGREVQEERRGS